MLKLLLLTLCCFNMAVAQDDEPAPLPEVTATQRAQIFVLLKKENATIKILAVRDEVLADIKKLAAGAPAKTWDELRAEISMQEYIQTQGHRFLTFIGAGAGRPGFPKELEDSLKPWKEFATTKTIEKLAAKGIKVVLPKPTPTPTPTPTAGATPAGASGAAETAAPAPGNRNPDAEPLQHVVAGNGHTCAILSGNVWCWGRGAGWHVGRTGKTTEHKYEDEGNPVRIEGLGGKATAVIAPFCAIVEGAVKCWGNGTRAWRTPEEAKREFIHELPPVTAKGLESGVTWLAGTDHHSCAVASGKVFCWGWNKDGKVVPGGEERIVHPTEVKGVPAGAKMVTTGRDSSCALSGGKVYCWGSNFYRQLGPETPVSCPDPRNCVLGVTQVPGLAGIDAIFTEGLSNCAVGGGKTRCWGHFGQLKGPDYEQAWLKSTPRQLVPGGCALVTGRLLCKDASPGELDADRVAGLPDGITSFSTASQSCATNGKAVWCRGWNQSGEAGPRTGEMCGPNKDIACINAPKKVPIPGT